VVCAIAGSRVVDRAPAGPAAPPPTKYRIKPVEADMHEFMGHVCKPLYSRLRQGLAARPIDEAAWKSVASDALILAEAGNLLLGRAPEADGDRWASNAVGLRTFGTLVYRSSREKDYQPAQFNFRHLVEQCNDCHREFAGGEPRLEP
jgi:hypothetical protein